MKIIVLLLLCKILMLSLCSDVCGQSNKKTEKAKKAQDVSVDTSRVYEYYFTEHPPQFCGGNDSLASFIHNNFHIGQFSFDYSGIVTLCLVIDANGEIINSYIPGSVEQALFRRVFNDLIQKMPKWIPGKIRDVKVKTLVCLPFVITVR